MKTVATTEAALAHANALVLSLDPHDRNSADRMCQILRPIAEALCRETGATGQDIGIGYSRGFLGLTADSHRAVTWSLDAEGIYRTFKIN